MGEFDNKVGSTPLLDPTIQQPMSQPAEVTQPAPDPAVVVPAAEVAPPPPCAETTRLTQGVDNQGVRAGLHCRAANGATVRRGQGPAQATSIRDFLDTHRKAQMMSDVLLGVDHDATSGTGAIVRPPPMRSDQAPAEYWDNFLTQQYGDAYASKSPAERRDFQEIFFATNGVFGALASGRIRPEQLGKGGLMPRVMNEAMAVARNPEAFGRLVMPKPANMEALYYLSRAEPIPDEVKGELGMIASHVMERQGEKLFGSRTEEQRAQFAQQWTRGAVDRFDVAVRDRLNAQGPSAEWDRLESVVADLDKPDSEAPPPPPSAPGATGSGDEELLNDLLESGGAAPVPGDPDFIGPMPMPPEGEPPLDPAIDWLGDFMIDVGKPDAGQVSYLKVDEKDQEIQKLLAGIDALDSGIELDNYAPMDDGTGFSDVMAELESADLSVAGASQKAASDVRSLKDEESAKQVRTAQLAQDTDLRVKEYVQHVVEGNRAVDDLGDAREQKRSEPDAPVNPHPKR